MSQSMMHGQPTMHTSRKHIVPTHLNLPDQVLTVWSLSFSARQLLLVLVGAGLGGTLWQHLAWLGFGHAGVFGVALGALGVLRLCAALLPFVLMIVLAWYRHAGRFLEVWLIVLVRYWLQPKRFLWCSSRACARARSSSSASTDTGEAHLSLSPLLPDENDPAGSEAPASLRVVGSAERRL